MAVPLTIAMRMVFGNAGTRRPCRAHEQKSRGTRLQTPRRVRMPVRSSDLCRPRVHPAAVPGVQPARHMAFKLARGRVAAGRRGARRRPPARAFQRVMCQFRAAPAVAPSAAMPSAGLPPAPSEAKVLEHAQFGKQQSRTLAAARCGTPVAAHSRGSDVASAPASPGLLGASSPGWDVD